MSTNPQMYVLYGALSCTIRSWSDADQIFAKRNYLIKTDTSRESDQYLLKILTVQPY